MRKFKGLLFLGSGGWSEGAVKILHKRLDEALSLSGGLQQSSQGEAEDEDERTKLEGELEDCVRDLAAALLGRNIIPTDYTPYPWDNDFGLCAHGRTWAEVCETDERGRTPGGCGRTLADTLTPAPV